MYDQEKSSKWKGEGKWSSSSLFVHETGEEADHRDLEKNCGGRNESVWELDLQWTQLALLVPAAGHFLAFSARARAHWSEDDVNNNNTTNNEDGDDDYDIR